MHVVCFVFGQLLQLRELCLHVDEVGQLLDYFGEVCGECVEGEDVLHNFMELLLL